MAATLKAPQVTPIDAGETITTPNGTYQILPPGFQPPAPKATPLPEPIVFRCITRPNEKIIPRDVFERTPDGKWLKWKPNQVEFINSFCTVRTEEEKALVERVIPRTELFVEPSGEAARDLPELHDYDIHGKVRFSTKNPELLNAWLRYVRS